MSGHRWYYDNIFHFRQSIYIYGAIGEEVLQWKDRDPNQDWETNLYLEKLLQVWTQKLCNIFGPFWKVTHGHYHLFLCDRERESQRVLVLSLTSLHLSVFPLYCFIVNSDRRGFFPKASGPGVSSQVQSAVLPHVFLFLGHLAFQQSF